MDLRIGTAFLFLCCITAIKCWVELDIAGNDLSQPNPQFVKPKEEDCDEQGVGGGGGRMPVGGGPRYRGGNRPGKGGGRRGKVRRRSKNTRQDRRQAFREVNNFAQQLDAKKKHNRGHGRSLETVDAGSNSDTPDVLAPKDNGNPPANPNDDESSSEEGDCVSASPRSVIEKPQKPRLRMIKSNKETEKEKVVRQNLEPTECTEIIELSPKTSIKIETYTIPYTQNVVKYKTVTRKVVYIQRRRKIKKTFNKPVLVIKRKVVKDRQFFERIIPKVIETREIINKPKIEYKVIEGPMEQLNDNKNPPKDGPLEEDCEEDCEDELPPPPEASGGTVSVNRPGYVSQTSVESSHYSSGYVAQGADTAGIHVGFDFASALNHGLNAAFERDTNAHYDGVVPPHMRSGDFSGTTPCPPGMVDNGLGPGSGAGYQGNPGYGQPSSNIYAVQKTNAYGQPVLSFQRK